MLTAFGVLAEPNRQEILSALADGELTVGQLTSRLGLSQPGVSKHLRVLREAGLVSSRVDGPRRLYSVRPEPLLELDEWLRQFWSDRLDLLEEHLERRRR